MKLKFKHQPFQAEAAAAVCDVFNDQPLRTANYRIDLGDTTNMQQRMDFSEVGFRNHPLVPELTRSRILENLRAVQIRNNLKPSDALAGPGINLTIEMETGTGKTYTYVKTMYELNRRYGWSKFIIVVPSVAIREGVAKSLETTQQHFSDEYGKKIRFFTYSSDKLTEVDNFASDSGIYAMIINMQAFNSSKNQKMPKRVHADDCTGKPLMEAEIRKYAGMQDFTDADWDELRAVYLGMCMKIDVQFGKLVEALKEEGIYDDCAIFFLSDHGDFTGDFDLPEKAQNCFEDCLTRVPLLIKPPKNIPLDPGISNSMVELVDFYATAMDLAGVQPTHTHFGHSLRPVLADRSAKVRDYVFCEGGRQPGETHCDEYHRNSKNGKGAPTTTVYWPKMKAQSEDDAHAKGIMMRDERYKYISRTVGKDELYDLQADPQEMTNRIDDESLAPVVVDMQRKMLKWLEATDDIVPFELDERFTPEMLWARVRGLVPPEKEAEVRKMIADGTPFPVLMGYCHSLK